MEQNNAFTKPNQWQTCANLHPLLSIRFTMATLKDLYELVRSLGKIERKKLSIVIEGTSGKAKDRYRKSLQIIVRQKEYNPEILSKKLSHYVSGMNLSEANTNFYNFICKNIHQCVQTETVHLGLLKNLALADTFISNKLLISADKILKQTIAKAEESRNFGILHCALTAEQQLDILSTARQQNYDGRLKLLDKRIHYLTENIEYLSFRKLSIRFFELVKQIGNPRSPAQTQKFAALLQHPLLSDNRKVASYPPLLQYEYYDLKCMILSACNKLTEAHSESSFAIKTLRDSLIKQKRIDTLQNLMLAQLTFSLEMEDIEKIEASSKQLLSIKSLLTNKNRIATLNEKILYAQLQKSLKEKHYTQGIQVFESHLLDKQPNNWKDSPLAYIDFLMGARLHFLTGNPEKALDCLLKIQDKEKVMRPTLFIAYKFLYLMCHYRLKNYLYLNNATTALYKSLYKLERFYAPEKALLQFLRHAGDYNKWEKQMKKLREKFKELIDDPYNKAFFKYGDYIEWLELESKRKGLK